MKQAHILMVNEMHGGDQIAQILGNHGINFLFTLCGGHIAPILDGCQNAGIHVIDVRNEATAVFAADAVSRLTGNPGVAAVTAGPGVTNSITAIANAFAAQSPLVVLGGAVSNLLKGRGALQDLNQIGILKPIVKWATAVKNDCDIGPTLDKAIEVAITGVPGPVFVEYPIDLLYPEEYVRAMYDAQPRSHKGEKTRDHLVHLYMNKQVEHLFACSVADLPPLFQPEESEVTEIPPPEIEDSSEMAMDAKKLAQVAELLAHAEHPVFLLGSQVVLHPHHVTDLLTALETLGVPVFLSGMSRGLLSGGHPLLFRHKKKQALAGADLVFLFGVPLDFRLDYGREINHHAVQVAINRSAVDMEKNRKPDVEVVGDPATFLIALGNEGGIEVNKDRWTEWFETLRAAESEQETMIEEVAAESTDYVNPLFLCQEINKKLEYNSIVVGDGGDFVATASYLVQPMGPLMWLDPGPFGTLGVGAGFALGAKLVHPEKEVWILYGDGAAGYSLIEFDTFVRHNIPVIAVVGNDAGWTQIARDQVEILGSDVGTTLRYADYHKVAEALGGKGFVIQDPTEVSDVLAEAKSTAAAGTPVLVNALIGKTDFRRGSTSM